MEQVNEDEFEWPCDLRVAHGPHGEDKKPAYEDGVRIAGCPGVKAHPNVMIGKGRQS